MKFPGIAKTLKGMKLTALILLIGCLHVAAKGFSQDSISLSEKNASLKDVLTKISRQSGYKYIFADKLEQQANKVTIEVSKASLNEVLNICFREQPFTFEIIRKLIVIKRKLIQNLKEHTPLDLIIIHGRVTDSLGNPLVGASITVKGSKRGTQSDGDGNFSLSGVNENTSLLISYTGFETQTIKVNANNTISIKLIPKSHNLLDVFVSKGYYSTSQRFNTGDVSVVNSKVIEDQPVTDPIGALEGRVAGLSIVQGSGVAGNSFTVRLRGQNSIFAGNDPYYIVDGVPFNSTSISSGWGAGPYQFASPLNLLNPSDIESITILKDADATAIYGTRGANGVILITTKKGKISKTIFTLSVYSGGGKVDKTIDLANTRQYLQMRHEAFNNDGSVPGPYDFDINGAWDTTRYTNWQKQMIGGTANIFDVQGTLSGGNSYTNFSISGGYHKEGTVFPGNFYDQKLSMRFALTHASLDNKFHLQFSAGYLNDNSKLPTSDYASKIFIAPDAPQLYDKNGDLNWQNMNGSPTWTNPLAALLQQSNVISSNLLSNLNLDYEISPGLQLKAIFGYNKESMNGSQFIPLSSYPPSYSSYSYLRTNLTGTTNYNSWIVEPQLNYSKKFTSGQLNILIGSSYQEHSLSSNAISASGFSSDALIPNLSAASNVSIGGGNAAQYLYSHTYGRINYNFYDKYLINITASHDGSSRFGPQKQFANFGAIGAGWIFSQEHFVSDNIPFISFGKLRGSYGITGNDNIGDYQFLSTYTSNYLSYQGINGLYPTSLYNPNFGWEEITKLEGAIELGFINNRILLTTSLYKNRDGNQLVGYALPAITGFLSVRANSPATVQNSGVEFELNTANIKQKNFTWTSSFNISFNRNKLISFPNLAGSSYATTYVVGQPLSIQFLFHNTGVDPKTGIYTFETKDGSDQPSYPDDLQSLKQISQDYSGGFNNSFNYKGFQLDVFFQFVKQTGYNYIKNESQPPGFYTDGFANIPTFLINNWKQSGNNTNIQQFTQSYSSAYNAFYNMQYSDYTIGDASFIRLKNISLSFNLPLKLQQKIRLQNSKIYVRCQNLFTITKYQGLDPETQSIALPPLRMIVFGIQTTF